MSDSIEDGIANPMFGESEFGFSDDTAGLYEDLPQPTPDHDTYIDNDAPAGAGEENYMETAAGAPVEEDSYMDMPGATGDENYMDLPGETGGEYAHMRGGEASANNGDYLDVSPDGPPSGAAAGSKNAWVVPNTRNPLHSSNNNAGSRGITNPMYKGSNGDGRAVTNPLYDGPTAESNYQELDMYQKEMMAAAAAAGTAPPAALVGDNNANARPWKIATIALAVAVVVLIAVAAMLAGSSGGGGGSSGAGTGASTATLPGPVQNFYDCNKIQNCSMHGVCQNATHCFCSQGYAGITCNIACPNQCTSAAQGQCAVDGTCTCAAGYGGSDCSMTSEAVVVNARGDILNFNRQDFRNDLAGALGIPADQLIVQHIQPGASVGVDVALLIQVPPTADYTAAEVAQRLLKMAEDKATAIVDIEVTEVEYKTTSTRVQPDCPGNCTSHGLCGKDGKCTCTDGYRGEDCARAPPTARCPNDCSGNGQCVAGTCTCDDGWLLPDCADLVIPCPGNCNGNGECDQRTGICTCKPGFEGDGCASLICPGTPPCSGNGKCNDKTGTCVCDEAFGGESCTVKLCLQGCNLNNGACIDGVCTCAKPFYGESCSENGCLHDCGDSGTCVQVDGGRRWECQCDPGYRGASCEFNTEINCSDGIDNDLDSLIDCMDPNCCESPVCRNDEACTGPPDPSEFLATSDEEEALKRPDEEFFSFFDEVSFLWLGSNKTTPATPPSQVNVTDIFDPELVAVIRGTLTSRDGTPLPGVRISVHDRPGHGATISRRDGSFDIAVNGGGFIMLAFSKNGMLSAQRIKQATPNQYVAMEPVSMMAVSTVATPITLDGSEDTDEAQVALGEVVQDAAGTRRAALMIDPGTEVKVVMVNSSSQTSTLLNTLTRPVMRITEFTAGPPVPSSQVGVDIPRATTTGMPAELPQFTGFTWAAELSVDGAGSVELAESNTVDGTTDIQFGERIPYLLLDNFLGMPVGTTVPVGAYNRSCATWQPSENGRVIRIIDIDSSTGFAIVDVNGEGEGATAAELAQLGFTEPEMRRMGAMYEIGKELWRVPIPHFTPWDCNWPYAPEEPNCSPSTCDPPVSPPETDDDDNKDDDDDDDCKGKGSVIVPGKGGLGELIDLGDDFDANMVYYSQRMPDYKPLVDIPLCSEDVPHTLKRVHLKIEIAGRTESFQFAPRAGLRYRYIWDGRDAFGRPKRTPEVAKISIGYCYNVVYTPVRRDFARAFNRLGAVSSTTVVRRPGECSIFWESRQVTMGPHKYDVRRERNGGWTFSNHHYYHTPTQTLIRGDHIQVRTVDITKAIRLEYGSNGRRSFTRVEDGVGLGKTAKLYNIGAVASFSNQSVAVADGNAIYNYNINTSEASLVYTYPTSIPSSEYTKRTFMTVDPKTDILYVSSPILNQIFSIDHTGKMEIVVGTGEVCTSQEWERDRCGDGNLAVLAKTSKLRGVTVMADGTLFFVDDRLIRAVGCDGRISTFNPLTDESIYAFQGPNLQNALFEQPSDIAADPDTQALTIVDGGLIYSVMPDDKIRVIFGRSPASAEPAEDLDEYGGLSEVQALRYEARNLRGLSYGANGELFTFDTDFNTKYLLLKVTRDGRASVLAGRTTSRNCFTYTREDANCEQGMGGLAILSTIGFVTSLTYLPSGLVMMSSSSNNALMSVALKKPFREGAIAIPFKDEYYVFDKTGLHLSTYDANLGIRLFKFEHNAEGLLMNSTDRFGTVTYYERDARGQLKRMHQGVGSSQHDFFVDSTGRLTKHINSRGHVTEFGYHDATYLLAWKFDMIKRFFYFTYDDAGRLLVDSGPRGDRTTLSDRILANGTRVVTVTSREGREVKLMFASSSVGGVRVNVDEVGAQTTIRSYQNLTTTFAFPDGSWMLEELQNDPVFGDQRHLPKYTLTVLPDGTRSQVSQEFSVVMADPRDPFSTSKRVRKLTVAGDSSVDEEVMDIAGRCLTRRRNGKDISVECYNELGLKVSTQMPAHNVLPTYFNYTDDNLLESWCMGDFCAYNEYDSFGRQIKLSMSDGLELSYEYNSIDAFSDAHTMKTKNGAEFKFKSDALGRRKYLEMPNGAVRQTFYYNEAGDAAGWMEGNCSTGVYSSSGRGVAGHEPADGDASLTGCPAWRAYFTPDGVGNVTVMPSGKRVVQLLDHGRRSVGEAFGSEVSVLEYNDLTDRPVRAIRMSEGRPNTTMTLGYNGPLQTSVTMQNENQPSYSWSASYDSQFRRRSWTLVMGNWYYWYRRTFSITYDAWGMKTHGGYTVDAAPDGSRTHSEMRGNDGRIYTYNDMMLLEKIEHKVAGSSVYVEELSYYPKSRAIYEKKRTYLGGTPVVERYEYTDNQQLRKVFEDNVLVEDYMWDLNGNRVRSEVRGSVMDAVFDKHDHLERVGTVHYTEDEDGFVVKRGADEFTYSAKGELMLAKGVGPQGPFEIRYAYDAMQRRVLREDLLTGKVWQYVYGPLNVLFPIAIILPGATQRMDIEYDAKGKMIGFSYHSSNNAISEYYNVVLDHVSTVKYVFKDSDSSTPVWRADGRNAFGFGSGGSTSGIYFPFRFLGGYGALFDEDTGLVHTPFREYDPRSGRFMAFDPVQADLNLYTYVTGDPINLVDPLGLWCLGGGIGFIGYIGASICYDSENGWGGCFEGGVGIGGSVALDPFGKAPDRTTSAATVSAGASAGVVGVGGGVAYELPGSEPNPKDPCASKWSGNIGVSAGVGPISTDIASYDTNNGAGGAIPNIYNAATGGQVGGQSTGHSQGYNVGGSKGGSSSGGGGGKSGGGTSASNGGKSKGKGVGLSASATIKTCIG